MARDKKMNNKVKVSKFWLMGGVCRIELWPELAYSLGKPWLYGARSLEELAEVRKEIETLCEAAEKKYHMRVNPLSQIRNISFLLDNFFYEYYGYVWDLEDDDYLHIKERAFK